MTGEKLASREGEARQKAMEEGGPGYSGPQAEMRHWVVAWVSPDRLHWKRVERPAAPFPSDGGNRPQYDAATDTYFDYVRVHGRDPESPRGIGTGVPERAIGRRSIGLMRTRDFFDWSPPKLVIYPTPQDEADVSFYGANYSRYPGREDLHLLFLQVYHQNTDQIDDQLAVSWDGLDLVPAPRSDHPARAAGLRLRGDVPDLCRRPRRVARRLVGGLPRVQPRTAQPQRVPALPGAGRQPGGGRCHHAGAATSRRRSAGRAGGRTGCAASTRRWRAVSPRRPSAAVRTSCGSTTGAKAVGSSRWSWCAWSRARLQPDMDGLPGFTFADCEPSDGR